MRLSTGKNPKQNEFFTIVNYHLAKIRNPFFPTGNVATREQITVLLQIKRYQSKDNHRRNIPYKSMDTKYEHKLPIPFCL